MSQPAISPSRSSFMQCLLAAAAVWLAFWYFARHIAYGGDDSVVLVPLFGGGLAESLGRFLRPLEYLVAWLSHRADAPIWIGVSLLAFVVTCLGTLSLLSLVSRNAAPAPWQILVCVATPLAAQAYFQIDTISQALANLFSLAYVIASFRALQAVAASDARRHCWYMVVLALLCILSKETTYGIVFLGTLLILIRHRKNVAGPATAIVALLLAAVLWRVFYQYGNVVAEAGFGLKLNPLYWTFALLFSLIVAAAPLPTSIVLSGAYTTHLALTAILTMGLITACAALLLYLRLPVLSAQAAHRRTQWLDVGNAQLILVLYLMASVVPTVFFKAAELYASQMVPMLKVLLLTLPVTRPKSIRALWSTCSALWLLASVVNIMAYSVATGYDSTGRALYAPIKTAVTRASRVYSIYNRDIYTNDTYPDDATGCVLSRRSPGICLPKSIGSGFPRRE